MSTRSEILLDDEATSTDEAESTSDPDAPRQAHVKVARGHPRARNLQVRFWESEYDAIAAYADLRGLPVSTVVRMLTLRAIAPADDLEATLDRLEDDIATLRLKALRT
jgi:hypothetical protein